MKAAGTKLFFSSFLEHAWMVSMASPLIVSIFSLHTLLTLPISLWRREKSTAYTILLTCHSIQALVDADVQHRNSLRSVLYGWAQTKGLGTEELLCPECVQSEPSCLFLFYPFSSFYQHWRGRTSGLHRVVMKMRPLLSIYVTLDTSALATQANVGYTRSAYIGTAQNV